MLPFVLASVLIAGALGCGLPPIEPLTTRVVNGVDAIPHSWPWQISLQYLRDNEWRHTCGGSLIATNWVMTAAHCINLKNTYRVYVGKYNLVEEEAGSKAMTPEKIIVHEKWNPIFVAFGFDVALIKLTEHVTLSNAVRLTCLPPAGTILPNNYPCYITGWGRTSTGGPIADRLQQALMPVVDHATCTKPDWWGAGLKDTLLCSGGDGIVAGCNDTSDLSNYVETVSAKEKPLSEVHEEAGVNQSSDCIFQKEPETRKGPPLHDQ
ncbi:hypothetical protein AMELA_G00241520 [Ameiurus melas]|uniref:Peptidase S1 domain-containing protein n=1 Tax=Ameiurus melas TaxID=219545 RepID=A0A7J5ZW51_AMEME|nr:hypothetical protein AMELA_G00241520 [Ameiurus melas]